MLGERLVCCWRFDYGRRWLSDGIQWLDLESRWCAWVFDMRRYQTLAGSRVMQMASMF